ncbi:MAG: hypothetical protein F6K22_36965 [Okeania sp. SIO2F4]|uniref:hypothetical protein n=1 Tax=Okeania sp. SIO2F4 TaxID=2607790 RepID=UPI00142C1F77|nr:hypothetical protein [Okeania sp. SIO2F4]NES07893.1 hypothetical protein [Okeania sp. SIO2F4]
MKGLNLSHVHFDDNSNVIDLGIPLFNPKSSTVKTGEGADKLIGTDYAHSDFGVEALVGAAGQNINSVIASTEFSFSFNVAAKGINNNGIIRTEEGPDTVKGTATSNISAVAQSVSEAIAVAETADTGVITNAFASIKVKSTADGIDNSGGEIYNGRGQDGISGGTEGSVAAVATATADASAIVEAIAKAPVSDGVTALAGAFAQSLAEGTIIARGINNKNGIMTTATGRDTITATATSSAATLSQSAASALSTATPGNQAAAVSVADAFALVEDKAIAIDNTNGVIRTGNGKDSLTGEAKGTNSYGISGGDIYMGDKQDILIGKASGTNSYGIFESYIDMGNAPDTLIGEASGKNSHGIFGSEIHMGYGDDRIEASSFGGDVNIFMGRGNDFVEGFGDARIRGGAGYDRLSLGSYKIDQFDNISFGSGNNQVIFELDGMTMNTKNFERFFFGNENHALTYYELHDFLG